MTKQQINSIRGGNILYEVDANNFYVVTKVEYDLNDVFKIFVRDIDLVYTEKGYVSLKFSDDFYFWADDIENDFEIV